MRWAALTHEHSIIKKDFQMNLRKLTVVALLAVPLFSSAADLVTNGGFEDNDPIGAYWDSNATTTFAPITDYGPCCAPFGVFPAANGNNAAFFGAGNLPGGSIWQDLNTVAGVTYEVSFDYGAIAGATKQMLRASAFGGASFNSVLAQSDFSATGTSNLAALLSNFGYSFTADSTTTRLHFSDVSFSTINVDGVLDNVSVNAVTAPVPEPETYALMLAGLGAMTFVARRRKKA